MARSRRTPKGRVDSPTSPPGPGDQLTPHRDIRRWIYGGLDVGFAIVYAVLIATVIPNRLPSASVHLWSLPLATAAMGAGTLVGGKRGWRVAVIAGAVLLASTFLLLVRIVVSAAFLAGVYGAFGKAAAMSALVGAALVIELVALLPVVQIKFLLTRVGRRAYGVPPRHREAT